MEIIIGREEGARRLHCVADGREFNVGQAGSVPTSVSRKHCKLTLAGEKITIENLREQNITYVDGNQVFSKSIAATSKVQLGNEKYLIPLQQILQLAMGTSPSKPQQPVTSEQPVLTKSLRSLEDVWKDYERRKLEIQESAAKAANMSRLQGILSMSGMCIGFIPGIDQTLRIVIIVAALLVAVFFFIKGQTGDSVQKQLHDLDDELATKYKCPNPKCGKPFGPIPYRQIEYSKQCLACGCKYTH